MLHFKAKMHQIQFPLNSISQFQFPLGLRKRPRWGAYSAPPNPLAGFKGPTSKKKEGKEGKEGEGMRKGDGIGGEGVGREGEGEGKGGGMEEPGKWSAQGPVLALGGPD